MNINQKLIRISELASTPGKPGKLPASPATIWRWVRTGKFVAPFKLGEKITVWEVEKVDLWMEEKSKNPRDDSRLKKNFDAEIQFYLHGESLASMSSRNGVSRQSLRKVLARRGVFIRPAGRPRINRIVGGAA